MFCAICIDGTDGLERAEDGKLECGRCRDEHPNYRGYSFGGTARDDNGALGTGNGCYWRTKAGRKTAA